MVKSLENSIKALFGDKPAALNLTTICTAGNSGKRLHTRAVQYI